MLSIKYLPKYIFFVFLFISIFVFLFPFPIHSQSSGEIQGQIENKRNELSQTEGEIAELQDSIAYSENVIKDSAEGVPKLKAEIEKLDKEIELNDKSLKLLEEQNSLKKLEVQKMKLDRDKSVKKTYKDWKKQNAYDNLISDDAGTQMKFAHYNNKVFGTGNNNVSLLSLKIEGLNKEIDDYNSKLGDLKTQSEDLKKKKADLEVQIAYFSNVIAYNSNQIEVLQVQRNSLQGDIDLLSTEQREAALRESTILANASIQIPSTPPSPVDGGGSFYFTGQGRDTLQGHGVGMSQWGAHGAGLNGWSYSQILTFYYSGSSITGGFENHSINVNGYGNMNIEDYVAGAAEVPAKACGNSDQANSRPDKYVVDNPNTAWDCWPEEAIKSQAIAFRTYGLYKTFGGGSICTSAACQVYNGGNQMRWSADETRGQVLTHPSEITGVDPAGILNALYSADNNQGFGTANNDTVFQGFGGGSPVAYLRAVNDSAFSTPTQSTHWVYQTGSYNMASITEMLTFIASGNNPWHSDSTKQQVQGILNTVGGSVAVIEFERDPSQRVNRVVFTGANGSRAVIGGWWFKNMWNIWTETTGRNEYLYSQTIFLVNN